MNEVKMLSIREIAKTGIISECALRRLVKEKKVPFVQSGVKVLINYYRLVDILAGR